MIADSARRPLILTKGFQSSVADNEDLFQTGSMIEAFSELLESMNQGYCKQISRNIVEFTTSIPNDHPFLKDGRHKFRRNKDGTATLIETCQISMIHYMLSVCSPIPELENKLKDANYRYLNGLDPVVLDETDTIETVQRQPLEFKRPDNTKEIIKNKQLNKGTKLHRQNRFDDEIKTKNQILTRREIEKNGKSKNGQREREEINKRDSEKKAFSKQRLNSRDIENFDRKRDCTNSKELDEKHTRETRKELNKRKQLDNRAEPDKTKDFGRKELDKNSLNKNQGFDRRKEFEKNKHYDRESDFNKEDHGRRRELNKGEFGKRKEFDKKDELNKKEFGTKRELDKRKELDRRKELDKKKGFGEREELDKRKDIDTRRELDKKMDFDTGMGLDVEENKIENENNTKPYDTSTRNVQRSIFICEVDCESSSTVLLQMSQHLKASFKNLRATCYKTSEDAIQDFKTSSSDYPDKYPEDYYVVNEESQKLSSKRGPNWSIHYVIVTVLQPVSIKPKSSNQLSFFNVITKIKI